MNKDNDRKLAESLADIVGTENVMADDAVRYVYSRDMTAEPPKLPGAVAMPGSVEEIQEIMKFANETGTPVVPFVTGTNLGGLTIAQQGGILLDLKRMNRILEVDEDSMYAVLEPGVSFGDMQNYLEAHHPTLRISTPAAPAFVSVVGNYLLGGLGHLAMKAGCHGDMINSLEAILPTGELIRTGSICASPHWFARYPLPDFCGLFIDWKGTSGIVTKMSIQLWPKQPFQDFYAVGIWNLDHLHPILQRIVKAEITDEQSGRTREVIENALGIYEKGKPKLPWEMWVMHSISAPTKKLFEAKVEALYDICESETKAGRRAEVLPDFSANETARRFSQFPLVDPSSLFRKGGGGWVGGYMPMKAYSEGVRKGNAIMEKHGFPPSGTQRTMGLGRYTILRFPVTFNKNDQEEVESVRAMLEEIADMEVESGALMYKAPPWASRLMWEKADPGYLELLTKIKKLLDPNDIMHPGMLGI